MFERQDVNAKIQEDAISLPVIATPIENDNYRQSITTAPWCKENYQNIWMDFNLRYKDFCQMLT